MNKAAGGGNGQSLNQSRCDLLQMDAGTHRDAVQMSSDQADVQEQENDSSGITTVGRARINGAHQINGEC